MVSMGSLSLSLSHFISISVGSSLVIRLIQAFQIFHKHLYKNWDTMKVDKLCL